MGQEHTSIMLMQQCLSAIEYLLKPLPPQPKLSNFYHPSDGQKNSELLFAAVGTGIATYALYKYLK